MKKSFLCALLIAAALLAVLPAPALADDIAAHAAAVYEPATGTFLYERNADERMLVASTTKIMTALVVLEHCAPDETVEIRPEYTAVEGSSMYLKAGETYTVEELLYGLLLVSGNDAAVALAEHTAGSIDAFAALMNDKCAELGLQNTHFVNPHGLDADGHYSSARDLALITAAAMRNAAFREIFATKSKTIRDQTYVNHNKLLGTCEGCNGGKTGYTEAAGRILVSCAERDGMQLICVTISDPDDWKDHESLYDSSFAAWRFVPALEDSDARLSVISGTCEYAGLSAQSPGVLARRDSSVSVRTFLPGFVFAPVEAGDRAGETRICVDGEETVIPIYYSQTVLLDGSMPLTPWERFKRAWYRSSRVGIYYPSN